MTNESGITPVGHRVLVRPIKTERVTGGGIIIPESTADKNDKAQIKALVIDYGTTAWKAAGFGGEPWANRGDTVLTGKFAGVMVKGSDGVEYRLVNDDDIQARIVA